MRASRYLGMGRVWPAGTRLLGRDFLVPHVLGLEHDGVPLLAPYCPPFHSSMEAAVYAVVARKIGPQGIFRKGMIHSAWLDPDAIAAAPAPSEAAMQATVAYCEYVYTRYGRFPAYPPPLRTVLAFQVNHVDVEFYDRFYHPGALSEAQRHHMHHWHTALAHENTVS
jgi:hypothetical protein